MYKRVDKRRRRKEQEEALGLDEDMKEVLGMQDTDSEESQSSEDGDNSDGTEEGADENDERSELEDVEAGVQLEGEPPMTMADALEDPVFIVSLDPEAFACLMCPEKELKNSKMIEVHKASAVHKRRQSRFVELAAGANARTDPRSIVGTILTEVQAKVEVTDSKRAEKRKAKMDSIRAKREKQKFARRKAKEAKARKQPEAATAGEQPLASLDPPEKKLKVENSTPVLDESGAQPSRPSKDKSNASPKKKLKAENGTPVLDESSIQLSRPSKDKTNASPGKPMTSPKLRGPSDRQKSKGSKSGDKRKASAEATVEGKKRKKA